jgi:hypothetical protein
MLTFSVVVVAAWGFEVVARMKLWRGNVGHFQKVHFARLRLAGLAIT